MNTQLTILKHVFKNQQSVSYIDISDFLNELIPNQQYRRQISVQLRKQELIDIFDHNNVITASITIRGIVFLMEYEKLSNDLWRSRWDKRLFWVLILIPMIISIIGLIISLT